MITKSAAASAAVLLALGAAAVVASPAAPASGARERSAVALSSCVSADNGDPDVIGATVSPRTVDVRKRGRSVSIRVAAVDTGGPGPAEGVRAVTAGFRNGSRTLFTELQQVPGGDWQGEVAVPLGARPGTWRPTLTVIDEVGQQRDLLAADLAARGIDASLQVRSVADTARPRLTSVRVSPTAIDVRTGKRRVVVTVSATDTRSGVRSIHGIFTRERYAISLGQFTKVSGTRRNGTWQAVTDVPTRTDGKYPYQLDLQLEDRARNRADPTVDRVRALGARTLRVQDYLERREPTVTGLTTQPDQVDVTEQSATITVRARLRDAGSGVRVAGAQLGVERRVSGIRVDDIYAARRVSGNKYDGIYVARLPVDSCAAWSTSGSRTITVMLHVEDRAGNTKRVDAEVVITATDRTATNWEVPYTQTAEQPVQATFEEDVAGVDAASAVVRDAATRTAVPGAWVCTSASGAPVDCTNGPVRTATFTPAAPLQPLTSYILELDPEHNLTLTDLAGNPYDRFIREFRTT